MPESAVLGVRNRFGNVDGEGLKGGSEVVNSNGKIAFRSCRGKQRLENSFGAIDLAGNAGEATIVNSNGPVSASDVDGDLGYTVNARTSFGKVRTDVPVESTATLSGEGLSGKIGNGRCKMTLTNNNGNIELAKPK